MQCLAHRNLPCVRSLCSEEQMDHACARHSGCEKQLLRLTELVSVCLLVCLCVCAAHAGLVSCAKGNSSLLSHEESTGARTAQVNYSVILMANLRVVERIDSQGCQMLAEQIGSGVPRHLCVAVCCCQCSALMFLHALAFAA